MCCEKTIVNSFTGTFHAETPRTLGMKAQQFIKRFQRKTKMTTGYCFKPNVPDVSLLLLESTNPMICDERVTQP